MYTLCNELSCCRDGGSGCCQNPSCTPPPQGWVPNAYYDPKDPDDSESVASHHVDMRCHVQAGIAYREIRNQMGSPHPIAAGHLMVAGLGSFESARRHARVGLSEFTSGNRVPGAAGWAASPLIDYAQNRWHRAHANGGVSLYSDPWLANVFGLMVNERGRLEFWPHADAAPDHDFAVGNDFRIMEGETCRLLKFPTDTYQLDKFPTPPPSSTADAFCGAFSVQPL